MEILYSGFPFSASPFAKQLSILVIKKIFKVSRNALKNFFGLDLSAMRCITETQNHYLNNTNMKESNKSQEVVEAVKLGKSLSMVDLYQCDLHGQNLSKVDFHKAILVRANLAHADFSMADLGEVDLRSANLSNACLTQTNLQGACLYRVNLCGADLSGANLLGAKLQGAIYDSQTIFPEGFAYKSSGAVGPNANLNGAPFNTANLKNADLQGINFLGAYLGGADLSGANLMGARLVQADLRRACLVRASLQNARLNGANLAGVDLRSANLTDADFEQFESIAGADFTYVIGLTDTMRSRLLNHPRQELETLNPLTLRTTLASLSS